MDSTVDMLAESLLGVWEQPMLSLLGAGYEMAFPPAWGRLMYSESGLMIATVAMQRPARTESGRELMTEFISYSGRYEVDSDGWVSHHVDVSLPTEWTDTTLRRHATLRGEYADLETAPFPTRGGDRCVRCTWRRVHPRVAAPTV